MYVCFCFLFPLQRTFKKNVFSCVSSFYFPLVIIFAVKMMMTLENNVNSVCCFLQTVNISCVYEDPRFDPSVDAGSDFCHKNILCMPIKNSDGKIIGVIQVYYHIIWQPVVLLVASFFTSFCSPFEQSNIITWMTMISKKEMLNNYFVSSCFYGVLCTIHVSSCSCSLSISLMVCHFQRVTKTL